MIDQDIEITAWFIPHRRYGELVHVEYDFDEMRYLIYHQSMTNAIGEINYKEIYTRRTLSSVWISDLMHRLGKTSLPLSPSSGANGSFGGTSFGLKISYTTQEISLSWQYGLKNMNDDIQDLWRHIADAGSMRLE